MFPIWEAAEGFLSSPTIRVDGRDVEPGADERTDGDNNGRVPLSHRQVAEAETSPLPRAQHILEPNFHNGFLNAFHWRTPSCCFAVKVCPVPPKARSGPFDTPNPLVWLYRHHRRWAGWHASLSRCPTVRGVGALRGAAASVGWLLTCRNAR